MTNMFDKIKEYTKNMSLKELQALKYKDIIKYLDKEEIEKVGPYHSGYLSRLIRAEQDKVDAIRKEEIRTQLLATNLTEEEVGVALEEIFNKK